jgi:hypothetical protein
MDTSPKEAHLFPESKGFGLGMANAFGGDEMEAR